MICPECGSEYREGFRECADCKVPLVDLIDERASAAPDRQLLGGAPSIPQDDLELVVVFRSNDLMVVDVAESILRSADIEFMTRGRALQGLFGWGGFPTGESLAMGPMEILCRHEDSSDALRMLENLATDSDEFALEEDADPEGDA